MFLLYAELIVYLDLKSKTNGEDILPGVLLTCPPRALKVAFSSVPTHPSVRVAVLSSEECFVCSHGLFFRNEDTSTYFLVGGRKADTATS